MPSPSRPRPPRCCSSAAATPSRRFRASSHWRQRGHTALSAAWGLAACVVYVVSLRLESRNLRTLGLSLFALSLAKLFLYDLSTLSSITRALSFIAVGAVLMAAGFFAERLVRPRDEAAAGDAPSSTA